MLQEVILLKNGEIALKGLNRGTFEDILMKNIKVRLFSLGNFSYQKAQSTIVITPKGSEDMDAVAKALSQVFGIVGICRAAVAKKDLSDMIQVAASFLKGVLTKAQTFKVEAKRSDKTFPYPSPDICREVGGSLLEEYPHLQVDVHSPDVTVVVEVRDFGVYVHTGNVRGAGGMPVGSSGKGALLLSGGIDSPVAGIMMARRGVRLTAIHFESPPYTSERARVKVEDLCKKMAAYAGPIDLFVVPFTSFQEAIKDCCKEEYFTLIMRRYMCRIAERIAAAEGCQSLITGESLGQVASQTMGAIACTDVACQMPILRPVIGMDKADIIHIAERIDTYQLSVLPYEDCCTVFTPRHPRTRPRIEEILREEAKMPGETLLEKAIEGAGRKRME